MPYKKTNDKSATVFTTEPESVPSSAKSLEIWKAVKIFAAIPVLIFWAIDGIRGALITAAFFIGIGLWAKSRYSKMDRSASRTAYRERSTFRVTNGEISKGGKVILVKDIHRLIIRNHMSSALEGTPPVLVGSRAYLEGQRAGMALNRNIENISYRVDVESGGAATTLAGGLTETAAFGLAKDIQAITGVDFFH